MNLYRVHNTTLKVQASFLSDKDSNLQQDKQEAPGEHVLLQSLFFEHNNKIAYTKIHIHNC